MVEKSRCSQGQVELGGLYLSCPRGALKGRFGLGERGSGELVFNEDRVSSLE